MNYRWLLPSIIIMSTIVLLNRCYYDSKEYLYPEINKSCSDTINVTYSITINTILSDSRCISCHNSGSASGNVALDTYESVKAQVDNGRLLSSIKQDGTVPPMPQGGGKLDNCKIAAVEKWIKNLAPKN